MSTISFCKRQLAFATNLETSLQPNFHLSLDQEQPCFLSLTKTKERSVAVGKLGSQTVIALHLNRRVTGLNCK